VRAPLTLVTLVTLVTTSTPSTPSPPLTNDARHLEQAGVQRGVGGVGEGGVSIEAPAQFVGAVGCVARDGARRRWHSSGIHSLDRLSGRQDVAELSSEEVEFDVVQFEIGERGNRGDLLTRETGGHSGC
jgi:hypothetical protein